MHEVRVIAPAKVNLALRVGAPRPDGFHPLETIFEALDLVDEITARRARGLSLTIEGIGADTLTTGPDNLVLRAAEALRSRVGRPELGADITVRKSIPIAGGMAGGSADAAGTLVALNALWDLGLGRDDLHAMAARLGSDVPFALRGGIALGRGRGEELAELRTPQAHSWVFVTSPVGLSTPEVFREYDRLNAEAKIALPAGPASTQTLCRRLDAPNPAAIAPFMVNDLQAPALSLRPDLAEALRDLEREGVARLLSGSGPTIAILAADAEEADAIAGRLDGWAGSVVRAEGPAPGARIVETAWVPTVATAIRLGDVAGNSLAAGRAAHALHAGATAAPTARPR